MSLQHEDITEQIINAYFKVYNELGYGFLERVYENAMIVELRKKGLSCVKQKAIKVYYEGEEVGDYFADILVEGKVILELKAVSELNSKHEKQLMNYLKATDIEVGLLLNFGPKPKVKRQFLENQYK